MNSENKYCPVCDQTSADFLPYGVASRPGAFCPQCESLERDRFSWLYMQEKTDLFDGRDKKVLHIAPEPCFEPRLRDRLGDGYLGVGFPDAGAGEKIDLMNINYPDQSFDVIYCNRVLGRVADDKKALREFRRVLKTDGWAILLVPITSKATYEDPTITDEEGRLKAYGKKDRFRRYGPDYVDRLVEAGFQVEVSDVEQIVPPQGIRKFGLVEESGRIFYCTK
ncbi:MAG: Methyltransferase type 11 [Rhodocyclales bacterium]|nr:Methyltransferase type 11 [Rhodocyclales bacterium]